MKVLLVGAPGTLRPDEKRFGEVLLGMRVESSWVERATIIVEFRGMIPPAGFVGRRGHIAKIMIRTDQISDRKKMMNRAVAHELKHLSFSVRRDSDCKQKWDEVDCERAEKRWGNLEFFYE